LSLSHADIFIPPRWKTFPEFSEVYPMKKGKSVSREGSNPHP
jgi:hypothetical protein